MKSLMTTGSDKGELIRYVALINGTDGGYALTLPDLPGCASTGRTITEALNNAAESARLWIKNAGVRPKPRSYNDVTADDRVKAAVGDDTMLAIVILAV
jgi:predicted RNase H-like HicB family nuclease